MYVTDSPRVCCWALAGVCAADIPLLLTVAFCEHVLFCVVTNKTYTSDVRNFAVTTQIGQCKPIKLQVDNLSGRPGKMRELELGQRRVREFLRNWGKVRKMYWSWQIALYHFQYFDQSDVHRRSIECDVTISCCFILQKYH